MKKTFLFICLLISIIGLAQGNPDTVQRFEAPVKISIPNTSFAGTGFGRVATANTLCIYWATKTIVVTWRINYFSLKDTAANIDKDVPPYYIDQVADKNIFVDRATGDNIALSQEEFLTNYGIWVADSGGHVTKDGVWQTDIGAGHWAATESGNYFHTSKSKVLDGWSAYMFFSTQAIPLRNLVMSGGLRLAARGGMEPKK